MALRLYPSHLGEGGL